MTSRARRLLPAAVILALTITSRAGATMVAPKKEVCPVCQHEVYLTRLLSFGSYIFEEPCKYDLIYPPASYKSFIATCRNCGYSQTVEDFLSISPSQAQELRSSKLIADWKPVSETVPFSHRLERAIQVNRDLERPKEFWAFFNRVLVYHLRELDPQRAAEVAKDELALVKHDQKLGRKQQLYLLGEYSRLAGDPSAAERFLRKAVAASVNHELIMSVLALNCGLILISILVIWRFKPRPLSGVAVGIAAGALVLSVRLYVRERQPNAYLDGIIADRIELLTGPRQETEAPRVDADVRR